MFSKDSLDIFKSNLATTNRIWEYFTCHNSVHKRIDVFSELINYIGTVSTKEEFDLRFLEATNLNPKMIEATPLFTAVSDLKISVIEEGIEKTFDFKSITNTECLEFLDKVDFYKIFDSGEISLPSYFLGVAVGLDSNGRKNRGGKLMENFVKQKFLESNWTPGTQWMEQVKTSKIDELFNIDFVKTGSSVKDKQLDFVLVTKEHIYLIETNFFNSGGSKINSMLSRFKNMGENINVDYNSSTHQIHFLWITDGKKLTTDLGGLTDAYNNIELIMNIKNLEDNSLDLLV